MMNADRERKFIEEVYATINTPHTIEDFLGLLTGIIDRVFPFKRTVIFYRERVGNIFNPFSQNIDPEKVSSLKEESNIIESFAHRHEPIYLDGKNNLHRELFNRDTDHFLDRLDLNLIFPLRYRSYFRGLIITWSHPKHRKHLKTAERLIKIACAIFIPTIEIKRIELSNDMNYYKLFKFDRLVLLGEMVAAISHELKTPLSTIMLEIQEMNDLLFSFSKTDMENSYRKINKEIHKINNFVHSLLSFSKFQKISMETILLKNFVEKTLGDIPQKRYPPDIQIITDVDNDLATTSDKNRLQQVLLNILFNAFDAVGSNGRIIIKTYKEYKDITKSDRIIISVNDNGSGIPNEIKEKVFEPFFTTKREGTGLGLYISYGIMKSLKGDLEIQSNENGTTVLIVLPTN
jgi:signal transduction histidine kinase